MTEQSPDGRHDDLPPDGEGREIEGPLGEEALQSRGPEEGDMLAGAEQEDAQSSDPDE